MKKIAFFIAVVFVMTSCVSKKKFSELQKKRDEVQASYDKMNGQLTNCERQVVELQAEIARLQGQVKQTGDNLMIRDTELQNERNRAKNLEQQMEYFKATNTNLLDRLSDLSIVNKTGAESIKKSLDALNQQSKYIQDLTGSMQRKDSLNLALVMNLKRALNDVNDSDVTIEVKKGVVYISLSDKMLFKSGSADIQPQAEAVLGKIAKILNDQKELEILVEGHTDNVPISNSCVTDNWDLSAKRATSVVRTLQKKYNVAPQRMTAGGRAEFVPKADNATVAGKATNRRTEIIVLPKLDQFFQLLEAPKK